MAISVSTIACSQPSRGQSGGRAGDIDFSKDELTAQLNAQRMNVICAGKSCSPSVAAVFTVTGSKSKECTGFIVADDLAYTNLHCLPPHLRKVNSRCGQMAWVFPAVNGYASETVFCSSILEISQDPIVPKGQDDKDMYRQDYALVRLNRGVNRPTLRISQQGYNDDTTYTIHSIQWTENGSIKLISKTCAARYGTLAAPTFNGPHRSFGLLSNCPIEEGNSGSPVLDDKNFVVGLVKTSATYNGRVYNRDFRMRGAVADNFACISSSELGKAPVEPSQCKAGRGQEEKVRKALEDQLYEKITGRAVELSQLAHSATVKSSLLWTYEFIPQSNDSPAWFIPKPRCYYSGAELGTMLTTDLKVWSFTLSVNQHAQLTADWKKQEAAAKVRYRVRRQGNSFMADRVDDPGRPAPSVEIKACQN